MVRELSAYQPVISQLVQCLFCVRSHNEDKQKQKRQKPQQSAALPGAETQSMAANCCSRTYSTVSLRFCWYNQNTFSTTHVMATWASPSFRRPSGLCCESLLTSPRPDCLLFIHANSMLPSPNTIHLFQDQHPGTSGRGSPKRFWDVRSCQDFRRQTSVAYTIKIQ